jgi:hypothetical protein
MISFNPKTLYQRFLDGHKGKLHFAAHSHHFWPDVTREAQLAYWDDCARLSDEKWDKICMELYVGERIMDDNIDWVINKLKETYQLPIKK